MDETGAVNETSAQQEERTDPRLDAWWNDLRPRLESLHERGTVDEKEAAPAASTKRHTLVGLLLVGGVGVSGIGGLLVTFGSWPGWSALAPGLIGGLIGLGLHAGYLFGTGRHFSS